MILSITNSKLGCTIPNFNLPRVKTCPGCNPACMVVCYARRANFSYQKIKNVHKRNYEFSLKSEFPDIITGNILELKNDFPVKYIRLHSSGDFYNAEYLHKWYAVAERFPKIKFMSYTRSRLDYRYKPDNFIVRYSRDIYNFNENRPTGLKIDCYIIGGFHTVPWYNPSNYFSCPGKCANCLKCWTRPELPIGFIKH